MGWSLEMQEYMQLMQLLQPVKYHEKHPSIP